MSNTANAATTEVNAGFRSSKYLALTAMMFSVALIFIDQTIVSIAAPTIQQELGLSASGVQWIVNGYLLAMAAFFAFGGRLSDMLGHKRMVIAGTLIFAISSAMCGLTPKGAYAETWIIWFRALQGFGAALLFPAALALVVAVFPIEQRGKALAIFFGLTGAFTAVGPIAGGYLTQITWRAIFWVNIPVAIIGLTLTCIAKIEHRKSPEKQRMDWIGAVLAAVGMTLSVLGFQQASNWGWSSVLTWGSIVIGVAVLAVFVYVETKVEQPLIKVRIFKGRAFTVDTLVLFFMSAAFIPVFFFLSIYAQVSLNYSANNAGLFLMWFFLGFVIAAQFGGRMLDNAGVKAPMIIGCAVATVGFIVWGMKTTALSSGAITPWIIVTGAGMGLILGPANTDAVNRAIDASYGEVSGVVMTLRTFGSAIGLAILGTLMINTLKSKLVLSLTHVGIPVGKANEIASTASRAGGSGATGNSMMDHVIDVDFAEAIQVVLYGMAGVMVVSLIIAFLHPGGKATGSLPGGG